MRKLPPRPGLPKTTQQRLEAETDSIIKDPNPKNRAAESYRKARRARWFQPVVQALAKMAGPGQRCMLCSGSEASDVEHYRPKAVFPECAMKWENYLWACSVCNRLKGDHFPPLTEAGGQLINPAEDNPWEFFFIDEFGILSPVYDAASHALNSRAVSTREILKLNRDALQESRLARLRDLKGQASALIADIERGEVSVAEARSRIGNWLAEPYQLDVADYFLKGAGNAEEPFKSLLQAVGGTLDSWMDNTSA